MSDYTPTTTEVREDFAYPWEGFEQNREGRLAAFDAWLAKHDAEVADKVLDGARKELQAAYKEGPGARLDGMPATWRKGVSRARRIVQDYQRGLRDGAA